MVGADEPQRVYCYGWHAACYDYFRQKGDAEFEDFRATLFYERQIKLFKQVDDEFKMLLIKGNAK